MAISILTNVPSLDAQRNLNNTQVSLNKNISHLSSGMRITSAADDAAGIGSTAGPGNRARVGLFSYQTAVQPPAPPARPDAEDAP